MWIYLCGVLFFFFLSHRRSCLAIFSIFFFNLQARVLFFCLLSFMIGIGIVNANCTSLFFLSHWTSSCFLQVIIPCPCSTITITIQRFSPAAGFIFYYSIHAIPSTAVEIVFLLPPSCSPRLFPFLQHDHCYDDPHTRTAGLWYVFIRYHDSAFH